MSAGPATMPVAVLAEPGRVEVREVPRPEPRRGEALVRLEGCGVCASNLAPWAGAPWFDYPFPAGAPGHEGWGVVEAVGAGVSEELVGRRVATLSDRAFAAFASAPADQMVPVPRSLDGRPFPGEPLGCAMNILARSDIRPGHRVAVVGVGFLGALLVQLAVSRGARVMAFSRRSFARRVAEECGAERVLPLGDHDELEHSPANDTAVANDAAVAEWTGGDLCDRAIECTGKQLGLDVASRLVRVRGRLVIAGFHQGGRRSVDMQLWNWRGLDVVNAHERDPSRYLEGVRAAVAAVEAGRLDPFPLLTHEYPLERLGEALDAAGRREPGFLKAVVRP